METPTVRGQHGPKMLRDSAQNWMLQQSVSSSSLAQPGGHGSEHLQDISRLGWRKYWLNMDMWWIHLSIPPHYSIERLVEGITGTRLLRRWYCGKTVVDGQIPWAITTDLWSCSTQGFLEEYLEKKMEASKFSRTCN